MDLDTKLKLARHGDMSVAACAVRLEAARRLTGMQQKDFALAAGIKKTALNNMIAGLSFPSREVMRYLWRGHRVDFNFILYGEISQLPADVQAALLPQLSAAANEWDRRQGSGQGRDTLPSSPQAS